MCIQSGDSNICTLIICYRMIATLWSTEQYITKLNDAILTMIICLEIIAKNKSLVVKLDNHSTIQRFKKEGC